MKNLFFIIAISLFLFGCIKPPTEYVTISGTLYKDCGGQPLAGRVVALYERNGGFSGGSSELGYDSTDANGYFELRVPRRGTAKAAEGGYGLDSYNLGIWPSTFLMTGVLPYDNLSGLKVYQTATCSIKVGLNVVNAYTSADTLFIGDFRTAFAILKVAGPFSSGTLYTANDFEILTPNQYGAPLSIGYKLNSGNWNHKDFKLNACTLNEVTIDVN